MGGKILSKSKSDMLLMTTFVKQAKAVVIWHYGMSSFQERDTTLSEAQNADLSKKYILKSEFQSQFLIMVFSWNL